MESDLDEEDDVYGDGTEEDADARRNQELGLLWHKPRRWKQLGQKRMLETGADMFILCLTQWRISPNGKL